LIEAMTFRFQGHVFGDADAYIPKDMKAEAMANDPVPRLRAMLIDRDIATEETLAGLEAKIESDIDEAIEHALAAPWPELDELRRDVYAEEIPA